MWPRSNHLVIMHRPIPSCQTSFGRLRRRPRNAYSTIEWVFRQHLLHQHRQPLHALSHVGVAASQVDPDIRLQRDHRRDSAVSTRRSALLSTCASTRTFTPHGRAISITPSWFIELGVGAGNRAGGVTGVDGAGTAVTSTRANFAIGCGLLPSDPSSRCRRHV